MGTDTDEDLLQLVAAATLDTPEKLAAFERWKTEDRTVDGLVKSGLISEATMTAQDPDPNVYGDHDMIEEVRSEQYGPDEVRDVRWVVCRRCGCEFALDERTQRFPRESCDYELAREVMRS